MTNGNLCPNGHPNLESAKFCIECGAQVTIANGAGSAQEDSSQIDPGQNGGSSKKRFVIVGSILGGLIVLVGIAAAIAGLGLFSGSGGNYGAIGTVVIQPIFDDAQEFSDNGLAPARVGEQWGYVNSEGIFVIQPQFDSASRFSDGLACVTVGERNGYIDEAGKFIIAPQYEAYFCEDFSDGLVAIEQNDVYGFIDTTGTQVITPQFDYAYPFSDGLAAVELNDVWGFVDTSGSMVIAPQFDSGAFFSEGFASVQVGERYGFIDKSGALVINPVFDDAFAFKSGFAAVKQGELWGYIDTSGEFVIEPTFDEAYSFAEGFAAVRVGELWGYIDASGEFVIEPSLSVYLYESEYSDFEYYRINSFSEGLSSIQLAGANTYGLLDTNGEWAVQPTYASIGRCSNGLVRFSTETDYSGDAAGPYGFMSCG